MSRYRTDLSKGVRHTQIPASALISFVRLYNKKAPTRKSWGFFIYRCLAVTYFRMRMHTIIGATSFHGPVRDGKGWVQSAMTAKRNFNHGKRDTNGSWLSYREPRSGRSKLGRLYPGKHLIRHLRELRGRLAPLHSTFHALCLISYYLRL